MSFVVTKLQKLNDHHDNQDQVHDQWFVSIDFADIDDAFPSLIDPVAASGTSLQRTTLFLVKTIS